MFCLPCGTREPLPVQAADSNIFELFIWFVNGGICTKGNIVVAGYNGLYPAICTAKTKVLANYRKVIDSRYGL